MKEPIDLTSTIGRIAFTEHLEAIKKKIDSLHDQIKHYCQAKEEFPLVDRWAIFKLAGKVGMFKPGGWIEHFDSLKKFHYPDNPERFTWYDDYHSDRYSTVYMVDIVEEHVIEGLDDDQFTTKEGYRFEDLTPEAQQRVGPIMEEILQKWVWAFVFDW